LRWQREVIVVLHMFKLGMQLHLLAFFLQDYVVQQVAGPPLLGHNLLLASTPALRRPLRP
jgi:hypothetical protein